MSSVYIPRSTVFYSQTVAIKLIYTLWLFIVNYEIYLLYYLLYMDDKKRIPNSLHLIEGKFVHFSCKNSFVDSLFIQNYSFTLYLPHIIIKTFG